MKLTDEQADLIKWLSQALELAREGQILALVMSYETSEHTSITKFGKNTAAMRLSTVLQFNICNTAINGGE